MLYPVTEEELAERIALNHRRLCEPYYQIQNVFQPPDAQWPGDLEGRALLAFVSHLKMGSPPIPCLAEMLARLPEQTGRKGYFGQEAGEYLNEQQLSGHSWYLRGLCEAYEQLGDDRLPDQLERAVYGLFIQTSGRYAGYPLTRREAGGVSGAHGLKLDGWQLSSDVGCAFMGIDGLSHCYRLTGDRRVRKLLDEMITAFAGIDKIAIGAQTHCSLSALRGILRMYEVTQEERYLQTGIALFDLYRREGMTGTDQNFNWWGRGDTWTEPCGVVDSLMAAVELYRHTGEEDYRRLGARIYHNGFASIQRCGGGAGTDTTVSGTNPVLRIHSWEAPFCCTMRLAEGLWYARRWRHLLTAELEGRLTKDELGRYRDGDLLYAQPEGLWTAEELRQNPLCREADGHLLLPLVKYWRLPGESAEKLSQRVRFPG